VRGRSHGACRAPPLAVLWLSGTRPGGLSWDSANRWDRNWPSPPVPARPGGAPMTTAAPSTALATIQPAFTDPERLALAGFLAGYRGLTREAYALDVRQFTTWGRAHSLNFFRVLRAGSESFARHLELRGPARPTVTPPP